MVSFVLAVVAAIFAWGFLSRFVQHPLIAVGCTLAFVGVELLVMGWFTAALMALILSALIFGACRATSLLHGLLVRRGVL